MKNFVVLIVTILFLVFTSCSLKTENDNVYDVVVYGGTSAAVHAINEEKDIQQISYARLRDRLLKDAQVLAWQPEPTYEE